MEKYHFELPKENSASIENMKVSIFTENNLSREHFAPQALHTHSYLEIFICNEGELTVVCENGYINVSEGEGIIVPANVLHFLKTPNHLTNHTVFGISITRKASDGKDVYLSVAKKLNATTPTKFTNCDQISKLLLKLENAKNDTEIAFISINVISELYSGIDAVATPYAQKSLTSSTDLRRIIKLEGLLNTYFDTDINTKKIAKMLYVTERHLSRIIKKHYGKTLRRVIVEKRLSAAALRLSETKDSAEAIGIAVGFLTKSTFYREFRNTYGITPMEYRRVCK